MVVSAGAGGVLLALGQVKCISGDFVFLSHSLDGPARSCEAKGLAAAWPSGSATAELGPPLTSGPPPGSRA